MRPRTSTPEVDDLEQQRRANEAAGGEHTEEVAEQADGPPSWSTKMIADYVREELRAMGMNV